MGALSHIKVVDLSRVLAGPWCTMTLGDLGADIIKIESLEGDDTRAWGPPFAEKDGHRMSAYFACTNRNKRSLALDLKSPQGQAIIHRLVKDADVVIENFKTGDAEKMGVGYATLSAINPRLVYCSISGYGRNGPWANKPGYDFIIQAEAGVMSITGPADGEPYKIGVAIADITAGQNAAMSILAALIARSQTGTGQKIDISLFDTQLQWLANVASNVLFSGKPAPRWGNAHPNIVPYQIFTTQDGFMALGVGNDRQWQKLCTLVGKPEWAATESPYATNPKRVHARADLIPQLEAVFATHPASHWLGLLDGAGIPAGRVNNVADVLAHPVARARGMVGTMAHPLLGALPVVQSPLHLEGTPPATRLSAPLVGEHSRAILAECGLDEAAVDALVAAGTVKALNP